MGDNSKIEWTDASWNPTRGCSLVSPGCTNCYAMAIAHRFGGDGKPYEGLTRKSGGRGVWTGDVRLVPEALPRPLNWTRPRRIFVDSMSDLFHPAVPFIYVNQVWAIMALCPQHTFQILTKRPERMAEYLTQYADPFVIGSEALSSPPVPYRRRNSKRQWQWGEIGNALQEGGHPWPLPNVWLGTSVEDQQRADERIPHLLRTPAAVRFLSCEPLLGPIELDATPAGDPLWPCDGCGSTASGSDCDICSGMGAVGWVIVGGESGQNARACEVAWVRSIRDQCRAAGVPVFVKQLGTSPYFLDSHGGDPDEWPEDLRVREFPQ